MSAVENYLIKHGFIFPCNEIYGRLQNLWDYGHLGVLLKENIKEAWLSFFVRSEENVFLLDGCIFSGQSVWEASGHLENFSDILVDCKNCKKRFRNDHLPTERTCPNCKKNDWTQPKAFNLMFKSNEYFLRPETAQSIFINFKNFTNIYGAKLPFSVAQVGKAFRNEITIQNSIFRTREFEQMELEFFEFPENAHKSFELLLTKMQQFLLEKIGIKKKSIQLHTIEEKERAHYSSQSVDIFFNFEHGSSELWGLANRGSFDLDRHQQCSKTALHYFDVQNNKKVTPHVIEHSIGLNRLMLAIITDAYEAENEENGNREILKIAPNLAPYKFAILPLTSKEVEKAQSLFKFFKKQNISVVYEKSGSIGKRYRKQDAIGTPFCITIDQESTSENLENLSFTIRERDNMKQTRITLKELLDNEKFSFRN